MSCSFHHLLGKQWPLRLSVSFALLTATISLSGKPLLNMLFNATGCWMVLGTKLSLILVNNAETDDSSRARDNWDNQNSQAYGNLMLCISADIRNLATKAKRDTTKDLLDWLKTQYSTTSISAAYSDVVAIDKLRIPGDCDPTPTLDKLLSLFTHLEDNKLIYTEAICAMTLLAKCHIPEIW